MTKSNLKNPKLLIVGSGIGIIVSLFVYYANNFLFYGWHCDDSSELLGMCARLIENAINSAIGILLLMFTCALIIGIFQSHKIRTKK